MHRCRPRSRHFLDKDCHARGMLHGCCMARCMARCMDVAWMLHWCYMDVAWMLHGCCMDAAWILHGCCMDAAWMLHGCCMDAAWMLHGCCMDVAWMLHGCCMDAAWMLHGCCMGVAWMLHGCCMDVAWILQRQEVAGMPFLRRMLHRWGRAAAPSVCSVPWRRRCLGSVPWRCRCLRSVPWRRRTRRTPHQSTASRTSIAAAGIGKGLKTTGQPSRLVSKQQTSQGPFPTIAARCTPAPITSKPHLPACFSSTRERRRNSAEPPR